MATIYPKNDSFFTNQKIPHYDILSPRNDHDYPLDIEKVIKGYHIEICKEDMDYDISGYIEKRELKWIIGVNKYHSKQRQRFTLAHEFAHYVLHRHKIQNQKHQDMALFRTNAVDPIEIEANNFAGELLIPDKHFKKYLDEGITKIGDLASKFDVSISAIRYKAYKLGYLNRV